MKSNQDFCEKPASENGSKSCLPGEPLSWWLFCVELIHAHSFPSLISTTVLHTEGLGCEKWYPGVMRSLLCRCIIHAVLNKPNASWNILCHKFCYVSKPQLMFDPSEHCRASIQKLSRSSFFKNFYRFYLFLERKERREKERKRNIDVREKIN